MRIFDNAIFDKKCYLKSLFGLALMVPLQKATGGAGFAMLVPFAFASIMTKRIEQMIFWLLSSMMLIVGNQYLLPKGPAFYVAQRVIFIFMGFFMLIQIFGRRQSPFVSPLMGMMFYCAYMAVVSLWGWNPVISSFKLFLFSIIYLAYYGVANLAGQNPRFDPRKVRSVVLAISSFIIFGSVLLIPFPGISQLTGEEYLEALKSGGNVTSLFKGMTMHSQTLGPVVASMFAYLFADFVINVRRMNAIYLALLLACPLLIYKTSSRTGMATMIMCVLFTGWFLMRIKGVGVRWRSKVRSLLFAAAAVVAVAVAVLPGLRQSIVRFALKYNRDATTSDFTVEGAMASRQFLIDDQMENFRRSPMFGNGFQVSRMMAHQKIRTWKDLISAPIEKGVWVTAVLEEGGAVGLTILAGFLLVAGLMMMSRGAYTGLSVLIALTISNMAEFTMFSMSAMGGYFWAMVFVGAAMDSARVRQDRQRAVSFYR